MERTTASLSEEVLSKFLYLKALLSGEKTPSEYMEILINGAPIHQFDFLA